MKQVIAEIYVKNCLSALDFYKNIFGGDIKNLKLSDELEMFNDIKNKVVHSELHINSKCVFYFVDIFDKNRSKTGNVTLVLHMSTYDELMKCYDALKIGASVGMPPQKTFWGGWHAILTDRFGAPWALNYDGK